MGVTRAVVFALFVWYSASASWFVRTAHAAPGDGGIAAANLAATQAGKAYTLGAPVRDQAHLSAQPAYDCSGLIWWVHANLYPGEQFPTVSQDQWYVGDHLAGSLWDGTTLPVGALLFLHDDNPSLGGGATHVSIYLGSGQAMDCYNETFGCNIHDVVNDSYYRTHWLGATYPWGDNPSTAVAIQGAGGPISPAGVAAIITSPGATYQEFAPQIQQSGAAMRAPLEFADTQTSNKDGHALALQRLDGLVRVMGWARAIDYFVPVHLELAFLVVLLVLAVKIAIAMYELLSKLVEKGAMLLAGLFAA